MMSLAPVSLILTNIR